MDRQKILGTQSLNIDESRYLEDRKLSQAISLSGKSDPNMNAAKIHILAVIFLYMQKSMEQLLSAKKR